MFKKIALFLGAAYPYIWPIAFLVFGVTSTVNPHMHFKVFGLDIDGHNLMWFLMALAHADIFWRGWCARHQSVG